MASGGSNAKRCLAVGLLKEVTDHLVGHAGRDDDGQLSPTLALQLTSIDNSSSADFVISAQLRPAATKLLDSAVESARLAWLNDKRDGNECEKRFLERRRHCRVGCGLIRSGWRRSCGLARFAVVLIAAGFCSGCGSGGSGTAVTPPPAALAPTFSPSPGTYTAAQVVNLADSSLAASIYYTLDGTNPTTASSQYSAPMNISTTTTINAFATAPGLSASSITSGTYTINLQQSAISPYYSLTNMKSGMNLEVYLGSTSPLSALVQDQPNSATTQRWQIRDVGNGFFELVVECSGMALDVESAAQGRQVVQNTRNGFSSQRWRIERVEAGYRLMAQASGKVLSVAGASTSTLANIDQETWTGSTSQVWAITPQGGTTPPLLPVARTWMIYSKTSDLAMEVYESSTTQGTPIEQNIPSAASAQLWTITSLGNGYYTVTVNGGYALSVHGNSTSAGASIEEDSYTGACGQQWLITHVRDGFYTLSSSCNSSLNLEVSPNSSEPLTFLVQDSAPANSINTPDNQLWNLALR